jgi:sporulation protein YlmC with PRC-barrel domain
MKAKPSIITIMSIVALLLAAPSHVRGDNIANRSDPTKHHHYANPDGKAVFANPNTVMSGHYNYNVYYVGNGDFWTPGTWGESVEYVNINTNRPVSVGAPGPISVDGTANGPYSQSSDSSGYRGICNKDTSHQSSGGTGSGLSDQSSGSGSAGAPGGQSGDSSSQSGGSSSQFDQNQAPAPVNRASNLIGMTVKNPSQETLGTIKDVVFNLQSGRVAYVVLQKAGEGDGANANIAVPLTAFTPSPDNKALTLNADKNKLQNSRGFALNNLPSIGSQSFGAEPVREHIIIVPMPSSHLNPGQEPDQDKDQHHQPESSPDTDKDKDQSS